MPHIDKQASGSFCWIELATTDQNAAKDFYGALFGWTAADMPMGPGATYTIFKIGDDAAAATFTMRPGESAKIPVHWGLYMAVASADDSAKLATELGGKIVEGPFDVMEAGRMAVVQDPTGAIFSLWQAGQKSIGITVAHEPGTLCWADLRTADPARAKPFYEGLFGWKVSASEKDPSGYLHIQNGESFIGGVPPAQHLPANVPPHWMIYFAVANVDESAAKAATLGATTLMRPMAVEMVGKMAILADPQGAAFAIFQPN